MNLFNSLAGMLELELLSADPGGTLGAINAAGIHIYRSESVSDLTVRLQIKRRDFAFLKRILEARGCSISVIRHSGLYWHGKRLSRRPVLALGLIGLLMCALYLPSRIFFIQVEGNVSIPTRKIIATAEDCGIAFGASRSQVRSEKVKNALLSAIPELQWAGVNTKGCVAVISVREKTEAEEKNETKGVSSIIADRDGVIVDLTVEQGNALCRVGQAVRAGQTLVSGYTDCGISIRAGRSVGDIYAQTMRELVAITPTEYTHQKTIQSEEKKYALIIGKKRINFYKDSGILGDTCDKMSTVNYLTLPGGFVLPAALVTEWWTSYECETVCVQDSSAEALLDGFCDTYLKQEMIAGKVLQKVQTCTAGSGTVQIRGRYACLEMIGREQREEILEEYGKSD